MSLIYKIKEHQEMFDALLKDLGINEAADSMRLMGIEPAVYKNPLNMSDEEFLEHMRQKRLYHYG